MYGLHLFRIFIMSFLQFLLSTVLSLQPSAIHFECVLIISCEKKIFTRHTAYQSIQFDGSFVVICFENKAAAMVCKRREWLYRTKQVIWVKKLSFFGLGPICLCQLTHLWVNHDSKQSEYWSIQNAEKFPCFYVVPFFIKKNLYMFACSDFLKIILSFPEIENYSRDWSMLL